MQVGICLLSKDGYYLREDGTLPVRPSWDKKFLLDLVRGFQSTCSEKTFDNLPLSVKEATILNVDVPRDSDINLGIDTFRAKPELMFIVRSKYEANGGKLLRLTEYNKLIDFEKDNGGFEIWKLNSIN